MRRRLGLALSLWAAAAWGDLATPAGQVTWRVEGAGIGSFSGLHVSGDGARFWAVSDKGAWVAGDLTRQGGRLRGVVVRDHGPLLDPQGVPVRGREVDAEGLTQTADGRFHVSFEDAHRVWSYDALGGPATPRAAHPDAGRLQRNSALEGLARDRTGALYTLPERSGALTRPFPVTRLSGARWDRPFAVPRVAPFLPVGAEFGPDGRFYVLERAVALPLGFSVQVRRFAIGPTGLGPSEVILARGFGPNGNMEGLSLWRDGRGQVRMVLISDDNGHGFLGTLLAEFVVPE